MARDNVTINYGDLDASKSLLVGTVTATTISATNGATIVGATGAKDNSIFVIVTTTAAGSITFKAGDYPNAVQGDDTYTLASGKTYFIQVERPTRFMKADGDIDVNFASGTTGTIFVIGKHAGLATA